MAQPTRIWKDILYAGKVTVPDPSSRSGSRSVTFTSADLRNAEQYGNAMIRDGFQIPVYWEHQHDGGPVKLSRGDMGAHRAKHMFGRITGYRVEGDVLQAEHEIDTPQHLEQLKTVRFVSPELQWDFRDGEGRKWPGITVSHVAATPIPVQHRQKPFQLSQAQTASRRIQLSLSDYEGRKMAKDDEEDLDELEDEDGEESELPEDLDELPEEPADELPPEPAPVPEIPPESEIPFRKSLAMLETKGIKLPPDTNQQNVWERLFVVLTALQHSQALNPQGDPSNPDDMPYTAGNGDQQQTPPNVRPSPQAQPVSLSLQKAQAAAEMITRKNLLSRVARLRKRGIPPAQVDRLTQQARSISLSFSPVTGDLEPNELTIRLEAYEELRPSNGFTGSGRVSLSQDKARVAQRPGFVSGWDGVSDAEFVQMWDASKQAE